MSLSDFWAADLRSVVNYINGGVDAEQAEHRAAWERARWTASAILQPYADEKKGLKPTDLVLFAWEQELDAPKSLPEVDEKRKAELFEKWDKRMKQRHGQ